MKLHPFILGCLAWAAEVSIPAVSPAAERVARDVYGAIVRGDTRAKKLSLVFTGDEHGESTAPILWALGERSIKAGFFITGNFLREPTLRELVKRCVAEGHYVGPHSASHPLYCSWEDREKTIVTPTFFNEDLRKNVDELRAVGAAAYERTANKTPLVFIPPYEWYNRDQVRWAAALGVTLINFTPGSGSNRDYAPESDPRFVPSQRIFDDILACEKKDPHGLNGFILLLHLGSGRGDPFHPRLGTLCDEIAERGYEFVRIDKLLFADE